MVHALLNQEFFSTLLLAVDLVCQQKCHCHHSKYLYSHHKVHHHFAVTIAKHLLSTHQSTSINPSLLKTYPQPSPNGHTFCPPSLVSLHQISFLPIFSLKKQISDPSLPRSDSCGKCY